MVGVLAQLGWDKQRLAEEAANPVLLVSVNDWLPDVMCDALPERSGGDEW
jgi:hypothetical protein